MNHFEYRDGELFAEDVAIARIADAVGTPFYCYSTATLTRHYRVFADALADLKPMICFALKANGNLAVVKTLADLGAGADVVSEGELRRALAAGVPPARIIYSGVGKTQAELAGAVDAGVHQINVESLPELEDAFGCRRRARRGRRHRHPRQPERGRGNPPQDLDRPQGGQVRHRHRRRAGGLRPGGAAARRSIRSRSPFISARSSPA